uniref:Retrotransposon gag domain-containing protein n=1 Tax=Chromera velia CCMP2878 TaxID=1169474 RepID=A0A0G4GN79_9ALVE|eukprot:Cvel_22640.t1-p1 / transcript=Cvel_22640.t1 / gene=Cvel_22640 / organism=Chromera_velia_CCMP2878 / gene_product=hypothetical protein / transcript_product=hypothetical protein / location=Cvel_scaffold2246:15099-15728(-) / protein_length=210 / sequence_SO=supercontig / SO=protein_coding / is_pseudo=false
MCTGSITDYNEEFSTLALKIPGANELDLVDDYIKGLPPVVRYETERAEPITLEEAMEKALDNELWLQDVNSRKGHWSRKNMHTPTALDPIDPTGPVPIELCGFSAPWRPTGLPPRHPAILQVDNVWDNRRRLHRCLLCGELDHQVRQYSNGPQLPPHMRAIQTSQTRPFQPFLWMHGYPWQPFLPFPSWSPYSFGDQGAQSWGGKGRPGR